MLGGLFTIDEIYVSGLYIVVLSAIFEKKKSGIFTPGARPFKLREKVRPPAAAANTIRDFYLPVMA